MLNTSDISQEEFSQRMPFIRSRDFPYLLYLAMVDEKIFQQVRVSINKTESPLSLTISNYRISGEPYPSDTFEKLFKVLQNYYYKNNILPDLEQFKELLEKWKNKSGTDKTLQIVEAFQIAIEKFFGGKFEISEEYWKPLINRHIENLK